MAIKRKEKKEDGAPMWVVTYGDMMSLLLTFFVLLVSMSELKQDTRYKKVMESVRIAFGYPGGIGRVPTTEPPEVALVRNLMFVQIPKEVKHEGEVQDPGIDGRHETVTELEDSWKITYGGAPRFERFNDTMLPGQAEVLDAFAEQMLGRTNVIEVVGHTTLEELPEASPFKDKDALALARARVVRTLLVDRGIDPRRIRIVSVADHEPLYRQAYDEERLSLNRRVEIVVREGLINQYEGKPLQTD